MDNCASAQPTGLSSQATEPEVSALRASIPCAKEFGRRLMVESNAPVELIVDIERRIEQLEHAVNRASHALGRAVAHAEDHPYEWFFDAKEAHAIAMEARRAETGTGSVHDSAAIAQPTP